MEIQPTGEVQEYSLATLYGSNKEGTDLVNFLEVSAQAEGVKSSEALLTFKYNRAKMLWTSDLEIPSANINLGTRLKLSDDSNPNMNSYTLTAELVNQQISEVTLTGRLK